MINKALVIAVSVLVIGAGAWYLLTQTKSQQAVAVVNGEEISRADYNEIQAQMAAEQGFDVKSLDPVDSAQLETRIIETLVSRKLVDQAIASSGISITEEDVESQVETIKGQFEDEAAFANALSSDGITETELREQILRDLTTQAYLEQELNLSAVTATDEEVASAYEQVSATEEVPPLEEVRDQVAGLVVQQKQQELVSAHVEELRDRAEIEILI